MKRRSFLKIVAASAGAVFTGAACGDDDKDPQTPGSDTGVDASDARVDSGTDAGTDSGLDAGTDSGTDAGSGLLDGAAFFTLSVASGDPKPNSVILWTRVEAPGEPTEASVELQVALDESFTQRVSIDGGESLSTSALASDDYCVKVRLTDLDPSTTYYYRFVFEDGGELYTSPIGRTKTAPAPDADETVRFAFVSCQDYNGVYYNPYKRLVAEEFDVLVHLGDYVYETTADPSFQAATPDRAMTFRDTASAIVFNEGEEDEYFAAKSVSNYRDLYRTHRSDPWMQRIHESFPMIAIWDDHEFTDDCWGATGTYFDGRQDETDVERRKNASQVWWEYMPVDYPEGPDFRYDRSVEFPNDIRIYRDLRFGANAHFVMTDLRTYRPDHVVAETEVPGAIAVPQDWLDANGGIPDAAEPYIDLNAYEDGVYVPLVEGYLEAEGADAALAMGDYSASFVNALAAESAGAFEPIAEDVLETLPRGLAISSTLKTGPFAQIGARYLAVVENYDLIAQYRFEESAGATENMLGDDQESWFLETMRGSDAKWKIWGNEFCLFSKKVDVSAFATLPESFRQTFYLSVEDWGGAMRKRDELIDELSQLGNVIAITGDIHAFFASSPYANGDVNKRITEFVTGAISSGTYQQLLVNTANADPVLREAGASALAAVVSTLMTDPTLATNPDLAFTNTNEHGFALVDVNAERMAVEFHRFAASLAREDMPADDTRGDANVTVTRFEVRDGSPDVWMEREEGWRRWDVEAMDWQES